MLAFRVRLSFCRSILTVSLLKDDQRVLHDRSLLAEHELEATAAVLHCASKPLRAWEDARRQGTLKCHMLL